MDVLGKTLEASSLADIMGYCDPKWISVYTYMGVMNYLRSPSPPLLSVASADVQPCLLVWGHVQDGQIVLEPAFQLYTRPSLPRVRGNYLVEGRDSTGKPIFSLSFAPATVMDVPSPQQNFVFAVPMSSSGAARLSSIRVSGLGQQTEITDSTGIMAEGSSPAAGGVEARRVGNDRVALRWDSRAHPMIMVRDPDTGEILSFARGGEVELTTSKSQVDLNMSTGVRSRQTRLQVRP
jgi:hypothetical protein